ncbi:MAG: segregation/condensation protein A [Candidatus Neomarinimicrobiota bacterium]
MSYNVKLDVFEGPLDLLLFFIKRDEINIYDIPISYITSEYLQYLELMKSMNLQLAGEFIYMASLLMRIKAQMLLPHDTNENLEEIEDPRTELVQMLVEYQQFKMASETLRNLEENQQHFHPVFAAPETPSIDPDLFLWNVNLMDLGVMFHKLIDTLPKPTYYEIDQIRMSIGQQVRFIYSLFGEKNRLRFFEIAKHLKNRVEVVVTFLAILEMVKSEIVRVSQKDIYGDIWLSKIKTKGQDAVANA